MHFQQLLDFIEYSKCPAAQFFPYFRSVLLFSSSLWSVKWHLKLTQGKSDMNDVVGASAAAGSRLETEQCIKMMVIFRINIFLVFADEFISGQRKKAI